ncbi:MAG: DNA-processing protein DprA [Bacteroidia bacterium]
MNFPSYWPALLALSRSKSSTPVRIHTFLSCFPKAPASLSSELELYRAALFQDPSERIQRRELERAQQDLEQAIQLGIGIVDCWDPLYPYRLKNIASAPPLLFYRGHQIDWNSPRIGAIVGSRQASPEGLAFTQQIVQELSPHSITWVSGFALGIDAAAHRAAIQSKAATWGVLAQDPRHIYPRTHETLSQELLSMPHNALVSEQIGPAPFDPWAFKRRNRLIAGLADFALLVESQDPSGSLITAQYAETFDRTLFAVPQHPSHVHARGPNGLIQQQRALLIQQGSDILREMNWP